MDASTLGLIFTGVAGLIFLLSFIFGAIRGVKKTTFRLVWLLVSFVLVLLLTPSISNMLNGIDISSLKINIYGKVNRLSDIGLNLLKEFAKSEPTILNSGAVRVVAENLPTLILNIFVFVIVFWAVKWLLWPIWALISSRVFDKEKREQKLMKKQRAELLENQENVIQEQNDPLVLIPNRKKKRFAGGLIGLVIGFLLCIVTFCPIVGINSIYQRAYATLQTQKDGETVSLIDSSIEDKKILEYATSYENSIINKIFNYTGVNALSDVLFSNLAVMKVADEKISLNNEVNMVIKVYNNIDTITKFNSGILTEERIDDVVTAVKEIFIDMEDSKIVYLIGDDVLPFYISSIVNAEDFKLLDGARFDELLVSAYNNFADQIGISELKAQAEALIDVVMVLNSRNLIVPIANGQVKNFDEFSKLVNDNIKNQEDFSNTIVGNIYRVDMLKDKYPELLNEGFKSLFQSFKISYEEQTIDELVLEDDFKKIVTNALNFIKGYSKSKNYDFGENTASAFSSAGKVLDTLKEDFFSDNNYTSLINYLLAGVNDAVSSFANFSEVLKEAKNITNWEKELTAIAGTYKSIIQFVNDGVTVENVIKADNNKLENIGVALDGAIRGGSVLVTNSNIRKALETVLNNTDTSSINEILNIELEDGVVLKDFVLDNIYKDDDSLENKSKITNWQREIKFNLGLIKKVYPIVEENFNLQKLSSEDNNQLVEIGKELDILVENTNLLLSNNVIRAIANFYLTNKVTFPEEIKNILNSTSSSGKTIYQDVLENIDNSNEVLVWETEFGKIKSLLNINVSENEFDLIEIGGNLDKVVGSKIITEDIIQKIVSNYITSNTESWEATGKENLLAVRNSLLENLDEIESYAIEFDYIGKLLNVVDDYGIELGDHIDYIGQTFNEICGISTDYASKVLTSDIINNLLKHFVDGHIKDNLDETDDEELIEIIATLEDNFKYITNYEVELNNLYHLILCVSNSYDANNDTVKDLKDIGRVIDEALATNNPTISSKVITQEIVGNLIAHFVGVQSKDVTEAELVTIITNIQNNFKNKDIVVASYEIEMKYLLDLFSITESSDTNLIGSTIESIRGGSSILNEEILNQLVLYFFDKNIASYEGGEYENIVSDMRNEILEIKNNTYKTYSQALEELSIVVSAINELSSLNDLEDFAGNDLIGYHLDELQSLQIVCNKEITYDISNKIVESILTLLSPYETYNNAVVEVLNSEKFDYYNYETKEYAYEGGNYYTDLINAIKQVLPSSI